MCIVQKNPFDKPLKWDGLQIRRGYYKIEERKKPQKLLQNHIKKPKILLNGTNKQMKETQFEQQT